MPKRILKFLLKLSVSLGFLGWIIFKTDWSRVLFYLKEIAFWKIAVYVILLIIGMFISAYKWKLLAQFKGICHSSWDYFRFYLTGTFINNFMPSFIGGDTYRAYQIGKAEKKYMEAASSVMADRITGFVGMTILALFFSLLNFKIVLKNEILIFINLVLVVSFLFDITAAKIRDCRFWKKIVDYMPQRISCFVYEVQAYGADSKILTKTIFWGMTFQIVGVALVNFILFWSLGVKISLLDYLSVIFLISIVSSIPISVNNIGLKEWAYVTFFGIYGIDATAVVTMAILSRFIQMAVSFFALPTYLKTKKRPAPIALKN